MGQPASYRFPVHERGISLPWYPGQVCMGASLRLQLGCERNLKMMNTCHRSAMSSVRADISYLPLDWLMVRSITGRGTI